VIRSNPSDPILSDPIRYDPHCVFVKSLKTSLLLFGGDCVAVVVENGRENIVVAGVIGRILTGVVLRPSQGITPGIMSKLSVKWHFGFIPGTKRFKIEKEKLTASRTHKRCHMSNTPSHSEAARKTN